MCRRAESERWYQVATQTQISYITDLAVLKTKEFKEVKELLVANQIVAADSEVVASAGTIAEIGNALTDLQASKFIDVLTAIKEPARGKVYSQKRINKAVGNVEDIIATINGWGFSE